VTHPITPPPELVQQWFDEANTKETMEDVKETFANSAAQWGADNVRIYMEPIDD
jgi:hypothetical protein